MASSSKSVIQIKEQKEAVIKALCEYIEKAASEAIKDHEKFFIGLSGGSVASFLSEGLPSINTDWSKWRVFFCDERHVNLDSDDSNYKAYKDGLFTKVDIPDEHIYKINATLPLEESADDYINQMKPLFPECVRDSTFPTFDLLVLGFGPDGHTCSLFPSHPLLQEESKWIASLSDSPKPPPSRITMTLPLVNNAKHAVFAACGSSKADVLKEIHAKENNPEYPASMVKSREVAWFVDSDAASKMPYTQM